MKYIKVRDLFKISKGKKVEAIDLCMDDSIRYIQIDDLRNDNNIKYCYDTKAYVKANKNDIIIAWDGANAGTIGFGLEGAIGSTLAVLRKNDENMDSQFCGLYLSSKSQYLREKCTGATIPHVNKSSLEDIEIPVFSIEIQQKIVECIAISKQIINKRKTQIEALDELIKSVFYDTFGDPVTNTKKWIKSKLEDKCDIFRGGSPRPINDFLGGTVPWIKIGDATKGDSIYLNDTKEKISEAGVRRSRLVKKGGIIFANCGVSLGFARIINFDGCIHDGWLSFENISEDIDKIFLLKLLNSYTDYFRETAPDGTQPNLNTNIMKNFEIIVPPMEIQLKYVNVILACEKQKDLLRQSLSELETNFNSLMQKAFKGELFN